MAALNRVLIELKSARPERQVRPEFAQGFETLDLEPTPKQVILDEEEERRRSHPWYTAELEQELASLSHLERLDREIQAYATFCALTDVERDARKRLLETVKEIIHSILPRVEVELFGSYSTGVATYCSDLDISVLCTDKKVLKDVPIYMRRIGELLKRTVSKRFVDVRSNARVPVIRAVHDVTGLEFDISFTSHNGSKHRERLSTFFREHRRAKVLLVIIKSLLRKRNLHLPFTGGMGSFVLCNLIMLYTYERHNIFPYPLCTSDDSDPQDVFLESNTYVIKYAGRQQSQSKPRRPVYAIMLLEFLELYGLIFNSEALTLCVREMNCSMVSSRERSVLYQGATHTESAPLSIVDFADVTNDAASGTFQFRNIRLTFQVLYYYLLQAPKPIEADPPMPSPILPLVVDKCGLLYVRKGCAVWMKESNAENK
ncbi:Topoisomerase I-related protein [Giardia muris]|uniref:Topoisomerase I-related protein n=1 Tax=Giardia muris TaxID=5742 RepID=A0A4Z1T3S4_GIAMU|nr:Topoisomerase I-related protein [Giardia muris]|eukprot:TNJ30298.1 Topoisomerase I-related protein [Giardia muris]